jgi:hypothetical protein
MRAYEISRGEDIRDLENGAAGLVAKGEWALARRILAKWLDRVS